MAYFCFNFLTIYPIPEAANIKLIPPSNGTIGAPSPAGATPAPAPPIPGSSAGVWALTLILIQNNIRKVNPKSRSFKFIVCIVLVLFDD